MSFALKVTEISKSFPGVLANDKINIEIPKGTIHAIVGENGAGKSTLMKVIYGMISPDSGTITVEDEEKKFNWKTLIYFFFIIFEAQNLSSIKYQTELAKGSTIASVNAI